ncbi:hypothetical protein [Nocardia asteroides]|uniref:hypothetical protein n=1 Tax=Nocardia asteroides TaxID=1824 RepID=UPI001E62464A|nr:hypothetical protein [Nocardia asteroides]UGT61496.1 hypothetical protein LTT61_30985 [Nocardia asteroides]
MSENRAPLLELRRGADHILARWLPDGMYELEHGDGGDRYQLFTADAVLVRDVLASWLDGEAWWHRTVAWSRIDPAVAEMRALRDELTGMLDGFGGFESAVDVMDDALARFDAEIARLDRDD